MLNIYYNYIREFFYLETGILLEQDKDYMINHRLFPLAKELSFRSADDFLKAIYYNHSLLKKSKEKIIDSLTTTETYFFRDSHYFDLLKNYLIPNKLEKQEETKCIRIWSAVCSSGQEPYSVRLVWNEHFEDKKDWSIEIYCSDINVKMLNQAKKGEYSIFEIQRGLTDALVKKYFKKSSNNYLINRDENIKMEFLKINLIKDIYNIPKMDIVFLRNILIYLKEETQNTIIEKIAQVLNPGGFLVLGSTEYLKNFQKDFEELKLFKTIFYKKRM